MVTMPLLGSNKTANQEQTKNGNGDQYWTQLMLLQRAKTRMKASLGLSQPPGQVSRNENLPTYHGTPETTKVSGSLHKFFMNLPFVIHSPIYHSLIIILSFIILYMPYLSHLIEIIVQFPFVFMMPKQRTISSLTKVLLPSSFYSEVHFLMIVFTAARNFFIARTFLHRIHTFSLFLFMVNRCFWFWLYINFVCSPAKSKSNVVFHSRVHTCAFCVLSSGVVECRNLYETK